MTLEYFDENSLNLLRPFYPNIPKDAKASIFFEQDTSNTENEADAVTKWGDLIEKHGSSNDTTWFATNNSEAEIFREFRHKLPETINSIVKNAVLQKLEQI